MVKFTNSTGKLNWGLVAGGLLGTVVPPSCPVAGSIALK